MAGQEGLQRVDPEFTPDLEQRGKGAEACRQSQVGFFSPYSHSMLTVPHPTLWKEPRWVLVSVNPGRCVRGYATAGLITSGKPVGTIVRLLRDCGLRLSCLSSSRRRVKGTVFSPDFQSGCQDL